MIKAKLNTCGNIIPMGDMKPMQVGVVAGVSRTYIGHIVMRTQNKDALEIMDLTEAGAGGCWINPCGIKVRLLSPGESITIEISND